MRSEYAMAMAWREEAFPAHEEDGVEELHEEMVPGDPADEDVDMEAVDRWEMSDRYLSRYHLIPISAHRLYGHACGDQPAFPPADHQEVDARWQHQSARG